MTKDPLDTFLASLFVTFIRGNLRDLRTYYAFPMVIYTVAGVRLVRGVSELMSLAREYRASLSAMGVTDASIVVLKRDLPVNGRMRVTIRVIGRDAKGGTVAGSLLRYFLLETEGGFRIEMVEYLEAPFPTAEIERILH